MDPSDDARGGAVAAGRGARAMMGRMARGARLLGVVLLALGCKAPSAGAADAGAPAPVPSGAASIAASAPPAEAGGEPGAAITVGIPDGVLQPVLGCWQLADRERWTIARAPGGGARVTRVPLDAQAPMPRPETSELMYDPGQPAFAFSAAGRIHALLFVFTVGPAELDGRWASSHAPGTGYAWTGNGATLARCR
jgi:hypothetical protein